MKNVKNIAKGMIALSLMAGVLMASPASAETNRGKGSERDFLKAEGSLKAEALAKIESATAVVLGPNGALRVMGAKIVSVTENAISATASFGNTLLNFVVNIDEDTKMNGKGDASTAGLKAGDKISFGGMISSSTSSSVVVDAGHVVSRALLGDKSVEAKNFWRGEVKSVNASGNYLVVELPSGREVKVSLSNSTTLTLDGSAGTLASVDEGDKVAISGKLNTDASAISATKIAVESDDSSDDEDEDEDEEKSGKEGRNWIGKVRSFLWR